MPSRRAVPVFALVLVVMLIVMVGGGPARAFAEPALRLPSPERLQLVQATDGARAEGPDLPRLPTESRGSGLRHPAGRWLFQTSTYTKHFKPDPRHTNHQRALDFEYWAPDQWVYGVAFLRNSFDQPTQYLYAGRLWRPFVADQNIYLKLTGGVLHGYKGEFRDKIPFNRFGYAPGLIPSIGYSWRRVTGEVMLLGGAALMVSVGVFWE